MPQAVPQADLLSVMRLRLNPQLRRAQPHPAEVVMRAVGGDRRVVMSPAQAALLESGFSTARTVPEVLVRAIAEHRCPPLREFYELVVQAQAQNILVADDASMPAAASRPWPVRLPGAVAVYLGGMAVVGSIGYIAWRIPAWQGPGNWLSVVGGWALACGLLSAGHLLAATVLAACGEVGAGKVFYRTRFPHFRCDADEAVMGGRTCELAVAALRAAPILLAGALALAFAPDWFPALCAGALYVLAPFGQSAARQGLASRRKSPIYSVRTDFLFEPSREDAWARWTARARTFVAEFGWLGVGWTIVWTAWSVLAVIRCMPRTVALARSLINGSPRTVELGAEVLLLIVLGAGFVVSLWAALKHWWLQRSWAQPPRGADARPRQLTPLEGDGAAILGQVPLFAKLAGATRAALAEAMQRVEFGRGEVIVREDEPGDDFFLIVSGEVEVRKRVAGTRHVATIGWLGPGDCFGEIALLENTVRTATLVARQPTACLTLGREDFERRVLAQIGATTIRQELQHARFLGRLTFTTGWSFADLIKFAQRCRTIHAEPNSVAIRQGEQNAWFYLIFDGAFEAREGSRILRRMGPGDYFGEISLLEGSDATATVVALEESRCLVLSRSDFLELFARDFRIGLRMEAVAERRLGAALFRAD